MKRTEVFRTEQNLYLLYGSDKDERIATLLAERLKKIIFDNGPNISIRIEPYKHVMGPDDEAPFTVTNGLVHCRVGRESTFLTAEEANEILWRDWYDYRITYETKGKPE